MAAQEAQENQEEFALAGGIIFPMYSIGMFVIVLIHAVKVFQDLYTAERKSVGHRRSAPKITKGYKATQLLTLCSITSYFIATLPSSLSYFSGVNLYCDAALTLIFVFYQVSKTLMYIVFLIRVYSIYQTSAYSYSLKCIYFFAILLILFGAMAIILLILYTGSKVSLYDNGATWPNWCGPDVSSLFLIVAGVLFFEDISVCIGFLWTFMLPLRKTLAAVKAAKHTEERVTRKIIYAGTKTTILATVSTLSTVVLGIITAASGIGIFSGLDAIVNSMCMILMTAYYKDQTHYQKVCCCCIKCCAGKTFKEFKSNPNQLSENLNSKENTENEFSKEPTITQKESTQKESIAQSSIVPQSVDTMSQLRVTGDKITVSYNHNHTSDKEMLEITPEPQLQLNQQDVQEVP